MPTVMRSAEARGWIEAARVLSVDASAEVTCPSCAAATLAVSDAPAGRGQVVRWISCGACAHHEEILLQGGRGEDSPL